MLNKALIAGRITKDIELRKTQNDKSVATFSVAVDRDFKTANGEKETDFINVVAWGQQAEFAAKYLGKGRLVVVDGRIQVRTWKDDAGNNRNAVDVVAANIYPMDSKKDGGQTNQQTAPKSVTAKKPVNVDADDPEDPDSLPF